MLRKLLYTLFLILMVFSVQAQVPVEFFESNPTIYETVETNDQPTLTYKRGEQMDFDQYFKRKTGLMVDKATVKVTFDNTLHNYTFKPTGSSNQLWSEIGCYFPFDGEARVLGVRVAYNKYKRVEGGDNYDITLYNASKTTKLPVEPMGFIQFKGDVITTGNHPDSFMFVQFGTSETTDITNSFVVAVALDEVTDFGDEPDSLEILSNLRGDGNGESRTVVRITNESYINELVPQNKTEIWYQLDKIFKNQNGSPIIFDYDVMIIPVLDVEWMSGNYVELAGMKFNGVYPNPTVNQATLNFDIEKPQTNMRIAIQTVNGQTLKVINTGNLAQGTQQVQIDTSDLPMGTYIYTLTAPQINFAGALQVVK